MQAYLIPIKVALLVFPLIAAFIAVPILVYEYHKYGSFSKMKGFFFYAFVFYMLCAYFLVILPLPEIDSISTTYLEMIQPMPFRFVLDFFRETTLSILNPSTYLPSLLQGVVIQPVFNIVMTIPFGIFLRYFFNKSLKSTLFYSFLLSLFFELTQLSGLFGIYSGPYRLFDVDDLMLNTLGGIVGYYLSPFATSLFPTRDAMDYTARSRSRYVSLIRRLLSFTIDQVIVHFINSALQTILSTDSFLISTLVYFTYYLSLNHLQNGQTLGQRFLHLKTASSNPTPLSQSQILIRISLLYVFVTQPGLILNFLLNAIAHSPIDLTLTLPLLGIMFFAFYGVLFFHYVYIIFTGRKLFFYEAISKTHIENTAQQF